MYICMYIGYIHTTNIDNAYVYIPRSACLPCLVYFVYIHKQENRWQIRAKSIDIRVWCWGREILKVSENKREREWDPRSATSASTLHVATFVSHIEKLVSLALSLYNTIFLSLSRSLHFSSFLFSWGGRKDEEQLSNGYRPQPQSKRWRGTEEMCMVR